MPPLMPIVGGGIKIILSICTETATEIWEQTPQRN